MVTLTKGRRTSAGLQSAFDFKTIHTLGWNNIHNRWDNSMKPAIRIHPGETLTFECKDGLDNQFTEKSSNEDVVKLDLTRGHPLTGPVYVEDACVGDTLEVTVLDLEPADWGWTAIIPGFGLLGTDPLLEALDFREPYLRIWKLRNGKARLGDSVELPLSPFLGVMGVTLAERGIYRTIPPRENGGNMDLRQLIVGSKLYLPVLVEGALFSCGDGHASQGDGEVCGTAIETCMKATLRFNVIKDYHLKEPQFVTPKGSLTRLTDSDGYYGTTGFSPDLMTASKKAIRYMTDYLSKKHGLSTQDAYCLCSATVDLKISAIVNTPNWLVSAFIPLSIFK